MKILKKLAMNQKYKDWIEKNVTNPEGNCHTYTKLMSETFPELRRIRGYYTPDPFSHSSPHWWLVDEQNNIVDPTINQYISPDGLYDPIDENESVPNSRCLNCGEYFYSETCSQICSSLCESSFIRSLM